MRVGWTELAAAAGLLVLTASAGQAQTAEMSFFVTSAGSGKGADLGGLAGADAICQRLAQAVGAGGKTWRAYLSTQVADGAAAVNARDRIGAGPWRNAKGAVIASSLAELHGAAANLTKQTALTEKGEIVNGRGDTPNQHDILTGSQADGTAFGPGEDRTCGNYTRSGTEGVVMLGHHDRSGLDDSAAAKSWNMSHLSRGCSQDALRSTGGAGLLYCFAAN
ncbi:hypothetical protein [Bosea sp. (in: a-proteobacteria)]|uniref:hypothetical protein n=1 Tax=Bosea sp. (in: a-proteobacteria) TaxID=1871050 RepID=UPI001ACBFB89|nr:hypothetical protein [Bosea sp. (in: a-proteobacteria)]MBN9438631.1 hypothetical protein [Bosea sp. (in: a-proteobacteria)]